MTIAIVILMLFGYALICSEHVTRINKATVALFCGVCGWVMYMCVGPHYIQSLHGIDFMNYLGDGTYSVRAVNEYIYQHVFVRHMVQMCCIVMYLLATMAIVEVLSGNECFDFMVNWCRVKTKWRLTCTLAACSFLLSANLDNLSSAVIMLTILGKLVINPRQRCLLGAIVIIATSCGGCFGVIGDVTSLLIWTSSAVTPTNYTAALILPTIVATVIPTWLVGRMLPEHVDLKRPSLFFRGDSSALPVWQRAVMLFLGLGGLWFVPTFHRLTLLPPFLGALCVLGVLWVVNEVFNRKRILSAQPISLTGTRSLQYEMIQMIMFFVGVSLCVNLLIEVGAMRHVAEVCDTYIHNIYLLSVVIGLVSAFMDNIALVMTSISIFPIMEVQNTMPDYLAAFAQNGQYWHLVALSGCVGGCLLPIGSTSGYALMKHDGVGIWWYFKFITGKVFVGWIAALGVYFLVDYFLR